MKIFNFLFESPLFESLHLVHTVLKLCILVWEWVKKKKS